MVGKEKEGEYLLQLTTGDNWIFIMYIMETLFWFTAQHRCGRYFDGRAWLKVAPGREAILGDRQSLSGVNLPTTFNPKLWVPSLRDSLALVVHSQESSVCT